MFPKMEPNGQRKSNPLFETDLWMTQVGMNSELNQNYNNILERDWLSAARFEQ